MEIIGKIKDAVARLEIELNALEVREDNKAAARRARKITLELTTLGKEFRKASIK